MFHCPNCKGALVKAPSPLGVFWACDGCGGRAASLGILRRAFGVPCVARFWGLSLGEQDGTGKACPVCVRGMTPIVTEPPDPIMEIDICRRCEFAWFDRGEFESIPLAPPPPVPLGQMPEKQLPPAAREALAMVKVQELARETADEPDSEWKTIWAFLGFPVEMDTAERKRFPWATVTTAALIVAGSLLGFTDSKAIIANFGFIPADPWRQHGLTLLTSFFLHINLFHLIGNLYFLIVFGTVVEEYLGGRRWLMLLLLAEGSATLCHFFADPGSAIPCVGASGGISGLITFYALKFPQARLGIMFRYAFFFKWLTLPAWSAFVLWILFQFVGAYQQIHGLSNVSSFAHLGGVVVGFVVWCFWRRLELRSSGRLRLDYIR